LLATCHSSLVTALGESGQADDGTPYIAMEFLEGESLRQALTRRGAIPVAEVAEILPQAARGLKAYRLENSACLDLSREAVLPSGFRQGPMGFERASHPRLLFVGVRSLFAGDALMAMKV